MQVHIIHRLLHAVKDISHELQIPQQSWLIKYATIITHTTIPGSYNSLTIHDLYTAFRGLFNRQHILNAYKLGFLYANGHNLSKMSNLLPSCKWEFMILHATINLQQQHIMASIFNTELTTTIMQPERIYSRTHIFQQKQWKEFITNTKNLLMYWSKFQAQITTSNRKEKTQQSHTITFKIKASIQKSRASSIRSTHILHMKIFADFPRKLYAQELGHKLGVMNFPTVTSEYNNNNLPSHRWGLAWTFCHWSPLDSQQQDSFNQRSHTSHNCMMMWIYILQNDRSNINNQLSWSLKVWYATSIRKKETLHTIASPQRESSAIDFPPAIFNYHSSKNSQHQDPLQVYYQPQIEAKKWYL